VLSIPFAEVLRIVVAARGDAGGLPPSLDGGTPAPLDLASLLDALSEAELAEILALALLGSGQFTAAQWREALADARANPEPVSYLATLPLLGDYLLEGCIELDYPLEQLAATSISRGPAPDRQ